MNSIKSHKNGGVMMKGKISLKFLTGVLTLIVAASSLLILHSCGLLGKTDYYATKDRCVGIFNNQSEAIVAAKDEVLENETAEGVTVKKVSYIMYINTERSNAVVFNMGSYGLVLGGQYWGFIILLMICR